MEMDWFWLTTRVTDLVYKDREADIELTKEEYREQISPLQACSIAKWDLR